MDAALLQQSQAIMWINGRAAEHGDDARFAYVHTRLLPPALYSTLLHTSQQACSYERITKHASALPHRVSM